MMRTDQSVRDLTEKHRYARATGDERGASRYKKMMASFGVAARFEGGRQQKHIVELTGLSLVDIDHIAPERMGEVLALVRGDEHTLLAYTTLSGQGLRILFQYQINENVNDNCYPLRSVSPCSTSLVPLKEGQCSLVCSIAESAESTEHKTNQKELSPFKGDERNEVKRNGAEGVKRYAEQYKQVFEQGNKYYSTLTGLPTDGQCKNIGRISTIAYDENLYYNPEATPFIVKLEEKKPVGRPRGGKSEKGSVKRCKVGEVEAIVQRELEQRGIMYEAGTYNKYVSAFCYEMNRYGVPEEECREWAVNRFDDYDTPEVEAIVRSCYAQTEEHGTVRVPRTGNDKQATVAQIEAFLAERVQLRRNVVTGFVEVRETPVEGLELRVEGNTIRQGNIAEPSLNPQPSTLNSQHSFRQFTDDDRNSLWRALSKELGVRVVRQDISAVVKSDFSPRYHPFEEYISSLQPWDGETDHITRLASSVTVKGDQEYFARCFKKWLVAFIAAIFDPEEVNHEILVFIGRQGSYKSTWFHYLLPPELRQYFLPKLMSNAGITKDDLFKIAQSGLVCLEEIDNMKQRDLNQLKAITTMRTINERRSYGEFNEFHRHIASFCATGNNRFFLTDHTGNRRFLTFEVENIVPPQTYDFGYEGVYAQAYALWRQGFRYWFDEEENAEINRRNTEFEAPNKEWELINKYYRRPLQGEECKFLTATDILERINSSVKERLSAIRVGNALLSMGYERTRAGNLRGYRVVEIPFADIERKQKDMGKFTDNSNEDTAQKEKADMQTELPF